MSLLTASPCQVPPAQAQPQNEAVGHPGSGEPGEGQVTDSSDASQGHSPLHQTSLFYDANYFSSVNSETSQITGIQIVYALINIHITQGINVHQFTVGSTVTTPPLEISYRFKASLAWSERKDGQREQVSQAERETWPQHNDLKHSFPLWSLGTWQFDKMWHIHTYKWAKN